MQHWNDAIPKTKTPSVVAYILCRHFRVSVRSELCICVFHWLRFFDFDGFLLVLMCVRCVIVRCFAFPRFLSVLSMPCAYWSIFISFLCVHAHENTLCYICSKQYYTINILHLYLYTQTRNDNESLILVFLSFVMISWHYCCVSFTLLVSKALFVHFRSEICRSFYETEMDLIATYPRTQNYYLYNTRQCIRFNVHFESNMKIDFLFGLRHRLHILSFILSLNGLKNQRRIYFSRYVESITMAHLNSW